jgi:hypothetical protein
LEPVDGVVQRTTFEDEELILVALSKEPLHLVRVHRRFA